MNTKRKISYATLLLSTTILFLTGCHQINDIFINKSDYKTTKEEKDPYEQYKDSTEQFITINGDVDVRMFEDPFKALNDKENEVINKMKEYGYQPKSVTSSKSPNYDRYYLYTILFEKIKE